MIRSKKYISVVMVEDDDLFTMMLDLKLSGSTINYKLTSLSTGEEALDVLTARNRILPSLIILDYRLPGINGLLLLKKIIKLKLESPVLMLSAKNDLELAAECIKSGATEYIVKDAKAIGKLSDFINTL